MKSLVRKAMRGDKEAFTCLITQYSSDLYKIARGILNNNEDVADAIQSTILICFEKIHTINQPKYFKTWMIRILINECNQIIRRYGNQRLLEEFPDIPIGDASMEYVEFQQLMNVLDEKYRIILILYYAERLKISEIAELLHLPESTVKTRLSRGRKSLAKEYGIDSSKNSIIALKKEVL